MTSVLDRPTVVEISAEKPGYDVSVVPEVVEGRTIYVARHPALERCMSQGDTPAEAMENLNDIREEYLADMRAVGVPVASPKTSPRVEILEAVTAAIPEVRRAQVEWRVTVGDAHVIRR